MLLRDVNLMNYIQVKEKTGNEIIYFRKRKSNFRKPWKIFVVPSVFHTLVGAEA